MVRRILSSEKGATTFDYILVTAAVLGVGIPLLNNQLGGRLLGSMQGNRQQMVDFIAQNKRERVPNRWFGRERMPNPNPGPGGPGPAPAPGTDPGPGPDPAPGTDPGPGGPGPGGPGPGGPGPQAGGGGGGGGRNFGGNENGGGGGGNGPGGNNSPSNGGGPGPNDFGRLGVNDLPVPDSVSPYLGDSSGRGNARRGGGGNEENGFGDVSKLDSVTLARYRPESMLAADIRKKNGGGTTRRVGLESDPPAEDEDYGNGDGWDWWKVLRFLLLILLVLLILWMIMTQAKQARR